MAKVSIGLRGWRFEESEIFTDDDEFKPAEEIPQEERDRLARIPILATAPCDACWLIHGDENIEACNVAEIVYGEPLSEVLLCSDHEPDFLYWFREEGGDRYRGDDELQDAFHEWFADGGRASEGYEGVEHVSTEPESIPNPTPPDPDDHRLEPAEDTESIDLKEFDLSQEYPTEE